MNIYLTKLHKSIQLVFFCYNRKVSKKKNIFAFNKQQTNKEYFFLLDNHKRKTILMMIVLEELLVVEQFFVLNLDLPLIIIENVLSLMMMDLFEYMYIIFYSDQLKLFVNNHVHLDVINQDKLMIHVNN